MKNQFESAVAYRASHWDFLSDDMSGHQVSGSARSWYKNWNGMPDEQGALIRGALDAAIGGLCVSEVGPASSRLLKTQRRATKASGNLC